MGSGRRAEIAGAGFAGLVAAIALARKGWKVHVHERSPELRMFGAGIWLWENGLRVLETLGVFDRACARAQPLSAWEIIDHRMKVIRRREFTPEDRLLAPRRADLYDALVVAAREAGVEIVTGSTVRGATPRGELILEDGSVCAADLVVGADGVHSRVRASLRIPHRHQYLHNGAIRLMIPRWPEEGADDIAEEYWNGTRVLLVTPVSPDETYLCFVCGVDDARGRSVPVDRETWRDSFPMLDRYLVRVAEQGRWDRLETVVCERWSAGRCAIVGDAAHAQPPWLGQAANLAFANALALAEFVSSSLNVDDALVRWERAARPVTDHVQRWTNIYGRVVGLWPPERQALRSLTVHAFASVPWLESKLNVGPRSTPIGAARG
jgi:2-polyprenyl-6-methoxyphenol hydroxylase-like FAD-dependent oxidoreductase